MRVPSPLSCRVVWQRRGCIDAAISENFNELRVWIMDAALQAGSLLLRVLLRLHSNGRDLCNGRRATNLRQHKRQAGGVSDATVPGARPLSCLPVVDLRERTHGSGVSRVTGSRKAGMLSRAADASDATAALVSICYICENMSWEKQGIWTRGRELRLLRPAMVCMPP
jgi:hypothetical protein